MKKRTHYMILFNELDVLKDNYKDGRDGYLTRKEFLGLADCVESINQ
jgi:hypothetical protein